jgi:hypothetical protein
LKSSSEELARSELEPSSEAAGRSELVASSEATGRSELGASTEAEGGSELGASSEKSRAKEGRNEGLLLLERSEGVGGTGLETIRWWFTRRWRR